MAAGDSIVGICNIGLIALGEDPITSLTDNSKAAILCNERFDQVRREVLASHPWHCAKKYAQLAANATPPLFTFANGYTLPADFIRMVNLPDNDFLEWEVVGDQLMTDAGAPLNVVYIFDLQDPTKFDAILTAAIGYAIGAELAQPLTQSDSKEARLLQKLEGKLASARLMGAQGDSPKEWDEDVMLRSRR